MAVPSVSVTSIRSLCQHQFDTKPNQYAASIHKVLVRSSTALAETPAAVLGKASRGEPGGANPTTSRG
jgi:hypothetical protein